MAEKLKPCPFCGGAARSDNGFSPAESIVYAWCSNGECPLHFIGDCGFTPEQWNARAQLPSQGGEAVAWQVVGVHPKHRHPHRSVEYSEKTAEGQAAHWRNRGCTVEVTPLYTHPADPGAVAVLQRAHDILAWMACRADICPKDLYRLEESAAELRALLANSEGVKK